MVKELTKRDLKDIEIAKRQIKKGQFITLDDLKKKYGIK